jgi:hypothetical protein
MAGVLAGWERLLRANGREKAAQAEARAAQDF